MYHNLVETNLFHQAPGYLPVDLESFWRSSDLPQVFKLEILRIHLEKNKEA